MPKSQLGGILYIFPPVSIMEICVSKKQLAFKSLKPCSWSSGVQFCFLEFTLDLSLFSGGDFC